MTWLYSLRTQLIMYYVGLILLGFIGLALWSGSQIETAAEEDYKRQAMSEVAIVARALTDPVEHYLEGETDQNGVIVVLENYARQTDSDLLLINNQGNVWLSTAPGTADETFQNLPEIITARESRITYDVRTDAAGNMLLYTAAPVIEDGRTISIVQLVTTLDTVQTAIQQRWMVLGIGIVGLTLITIGLSVLISASLTRPLAKMRQAAMKITEGDFSTQVPDQRRDEFGQVAKAFNEMSGQVQAMLEEQRAFAGNASHELRTPLTTIGLRIEALLDQDLDPEKRVRYLHEADDEIRRMKNLVDDLILLSGFDAGAVDIGRDMIDMPRFARQMIRKIQPLAEKQAITITLDADETMPAVCANLTHLQVVYRNILDNAIKYMGSDGGEIMWTMHANEEQLTTMITDTGQGIASADIENVRNRFYRGDKAHSRTVQGAGLGLSLVQSIVNAYGGQFTVKSDGVGTGTTVIITWKTTHGSIHAQP